MIYVRYVEGRTYHLDKNIMLLITEGIGKLLDPVAYSIISENNAAQYLTKYLDSIKRRKMIVGKRYRKYFNLERYEPDGTFFYTKEKTDIINKQAILRKGERRVLR